MTTATSRSLIAAAAVIVGSHALAATFRPSTTQTAIDAASIQTALVQSLQTVGNANALESQFQNTTTNDANTLAEIARVEIEQGNLSGAIKLFGRSTLPSSQIQLAYLQEATGDTHGAEVTLQNNIASTISSKQSFDLGLRLALLLLDEGKQAGALPLLDHAASLSSDGAAAAGMIASLFGQYDAATRYLKLGAVEDTSLQLLRGNAAMEAGQAELSKAIFNGVFESANKSVDRRYSADRMIAAARLSGTLSTLPDAWLANKDLAPDQLMSLATTLRELGRVSDLLDWWQREATKPVVAKVMLSRQMVDEVIGAAMEAGRGSDAEAVCKKVLFRQPDSLSWLEATVRIELDLGHAADADSLLRSRIAAAENFPDKLQQLAKLARSLGRDDEALKASGFLQKLGGGNEIAGLILASSVRLRAGDEPVVKVLLHRAASLAINEPALIPEVTAAMESANLHDEEIQLLQSDPTLQNDSDAQQQLATILILEHRPQDAAVIFDRLRKTAASDAIRDQSAQRLLDATANAGTMPALVEMLESAMKNGHADTGDVGLLVNAYLQSHHPQAAVNLLETTNLLDAKSRAHQLCTLYLRQHNTLEAAKALRQLVVLEPADAIVHLEQLASIYLGQKQTEQAQQVISEIQQRTGTGAPSADLLGGLYDRLSRPADAADQYRRALAIGGDDGDGWLLWSTAMAKSGRSAAAIGRLQVVEEEATNDAMFIAAVDGLLNLDPPHVALKAARRQTILRLVNERHSIALYHLLADLCDQLQDNSFAIRVAEMSVAMNAEERPQTLRSLMDLDANAGMVDNAADCGRSVLALGDDFPPQMFLTLGEQLLVCGRTAQAREAFSRAADAGSDDLVGPRATELYDRYNDPADGLRITKRLLERNPRDMTLHQTAGSELEVQGDYSHAFDQYMTSLAAAAKDLPTEAAVAPDIRFTHQASPSVESLNQLVYASLYCARQVGQQDRLLTLLESQCLRLAAESAEEVPTANVVYLAASVRRVAFAVGRLKVANHVDGLLLQRWPQSEILITAGFNDRREYGLYSEALNFRATYHPQQIDELTNLALMQGSVAATSQPVESPMSAITQLPNLMMRGQTGQATLLLKAISPDELESSIDFSIALSTAAALGDHNQSRRFGDAWLKLVLDRAISSAPSQARQMNSGMSLDYRNFQIVKQVVSSLSVFYNAEELKQVVKQLTAAVQQTKNQVISQNLSQFTLQVANLAGVSLPDELNLSEQWAHQRSYTFIPAQAVAMFQLAPAADRSDVLTKVLQSLPADHQLQFLLQIAAMSPDAFDDATNQSIVSAADAVPAGQTTQWCNWFSNESQKRVLPSLLAAVIRNLPSQHSTADSSSLLVEAAIAAHTIDNQASADGLAGRAIAAYSRYVPVEAAEAESGRSSRSVGGNDSALHPSPFGMLQRAACVLSPTAREQLYNSIQASASLDSTGADAPITAWHEAVMAVLLQSLGYRDEALPHLRRAYETNPGDAAIRRALADRLDDDGRRAEFLERFGTGALSVAASAPDLRATAIDDLMQLFRGSETWPLSAANSRPPMLPLDFITPAATGDDQQSAAVFRVMLKESRSRSMFGQVPIYQPDFGGLRTVSTKLWHDSKGVFEHLELWKGSANDLLSAIEAYPLTTSVSTPLSYYLNEQLENMINVLANSAAHDGPLCDDLLKRLESRAINGSMIASQRLLLQKIACNPCVHLSPILIDELRKMAAFESSGKGAFLLAQSLAAQQSPDEPAVKRWGDAATINPLDSSIPSTLLDSAAERSHSFVGPFDEVKDATLSDELERRINSGDCKAVEAELSRLRRNGRIDRQNCPELGLIWARLAAERGDVNTFQNRLNEVLELWGWQTDVPPLLDFRRCLPGHTSQDNRGSLIQAVTSSLDHANASWPGCTKVTRYYCMTGQWADQRGDKDRAERIAATAEKCGNLQGVGEQQLWIADLLEELGHLDKSTQTQIALLHQRCLSGYRITTILTGLSKNGNAASANLLVKISKSYCRLPALLVQQP